MKAKPKKTKVAIITNIPTPYRNPLFEHLSKNNRNIEFVVYFFAKYEKNRSWKFSEPFKFKYKFLKGISMSWRKKDDDLFTLHINFSIIFEIFKEKYDVVICSGYNSISAIITLLCTKILRKPFIHWTEQTLEAEPSKSLISNLIRNLLKKTFLKLSDAHIAAGNHTKNFLVANKVDKKRIFISPNAIDLSYFLSNVNVYRTKKDILKKELNLNNKIIILYVGQLISRKGIFDLLEAYNNLDIKEKETTYLLIIGEGPLYIDVKKYCYERNLKNVILTGYKQQSELLKYYAISDIFILPSKYDIWGFVVNEAMACSLPIITTINVGASGDIVKNGVNGYVAKTSDPNELSKLIKILIKDRDLRERMGKNSRNIIIDWNLDKAVEGFLNSIDFVLAQKTN